MAQPGELDLLLTISEGEAEALGRLLRAVLSGNARNRLAFGVRPDDLGYLDSIDDQLQTQMHGPIEELLPLETTADVRAFVKTSLDSLCTEAAMRVGLPHH